MYKQEHDLYEHHFLKTETMENKLTAVSDRIVLILDDAETKIGGIIIPDNAKEKPASGKVVSVGPNCREVNVGDTIVFISNHGAKYTNDGIEYLILKEQDVLVIVKP